MEVKSSIMLYQSVKESIVAADGAHLKQPVALAAAQIYVDKAAFGQLGRLRRFGHLGLCFVTFSTPNRYPLRLKAL